MRLLKIPEAAERLACSDDYVYKLIGDGDLSKVDLGDGRSMTRVADAEIDAFIKRKTTNAKRKPK